MVHITAEAVKQFKRLMTDAQMAGASIRIYSSGGGCCGPQFGMDITPKGEPGDLPMETDGLKVYLDPQASTALAQATIDYLQSGPRKGFVIQGLGSSCCG